MITALSAGATDAIWRHVKQRRVLTTGSSSCITDVTGKYDSMTTASAAWGVHYGKRLQSDCQRRTRLLNEAVLGAEAEINELFAELDATRRYGFENTAMAVADEAGDVWYGLSVMLSHTLSRLSVCCTGGKLTWLTTLLLGFRHMGVCDPAQIAVGAHHLIYRKIQE